MALEEINSSRSRGKGNPEFLPTLACHTKRTTAVIRTSSFSKILSLKRPLSWLKTPIYVIKYIEQELAKKRGRKIDANDQVENELKRAEDELYKIPEHLKVKRRNSKESSIQCTTGIAEVQLPIEYKLRNIEETEAAKTLLQEKRLRRTKSEFSITSGYSADYFQRGKDYAEKLRREHPSLYRELLRMIVLEPNRTIPALMQRGRGKLQQMSLMLERFRKRERHRVTRR